MGRATSLPRMSKTRRDTSQGDRARFLTGGARRVVAFEAAWLQRLRDTRIYIYDMPSGPFQPALREAGYWVCRETVEPQGVEVVEDILGALIAAGAEVRLLQDFWLLAEAVAASTLEFSIIRQRNARPRPTRI